MSDRFSPGDRVRVRADSTPGHIRTPVYIRGKRGVVRRIYGDFPNPEGLAYGQPGLPPSWYKSREYRSRMVREPRSVLKEFGTELAKNVEVRVHDSTADMRYLVLPMRPEGTQEMDEDALAALVTRDCMIGVTVPKV